MTEQSTAGPDPLRLESFLPYRLSLLASLASRAHAAICAAHDLAPAEWTVLAAAAEQPGISAKAIGATFGMQKAKVSRAVSALVDRKLITSTPHRRDRRLADLEPTSQGTELYRRCAPAMIELSRSLEAALDSSDHAVVERVLKKLSQLPLGAQSGGIEAGDIGAAGPPEGGG